MNVRRWIVGTLIALTLLFAGLAATLLIVVDPNDFKPQIVQAVRDNTGRELTISGDLALEFFPYLSVSIGELELGNSEGFSGPFLTLTGAHLKARLLPLLASRLDVVAIEIDGLSLFLARDAQGRGNWMDLATPEAADSAPDDSPVLARDRRVPVLASLIVDGLEVSEAQVVWDDRQGDERFEVSGIRLDVSDFAFGEPFVVDTRARATRGGITGDLDFTARAVLELDRLSVEDLVMQAVLSGASLPNSPETIALSMDFFHRRPHRKRAYAGAGSRCSLFGQCGARFCKKRGAGRGRVQSKGCLCAPRPCLSRFPGSFRHGDGVILLRMVRCWRSY